jgi:hypothetical protein
MILAKEETLFFSGPRIRLPPFGATTGVLHHRNLPIAQAVIANANVLAAHVDDLRGTIGIGTGTGIGTIVIEREEADPLIGGEAQPPIAEGTTATATTVLEPLQLKMTRKMTEKKIGLRPLPMIIKSLFLFLLFQICLPLFSSFCFRLPWPFLLSFLDPKIRAPICFNDARLSSD